MIPISDQLMAAFRARLASMGIDAGVDQTAPVEVVRPEAVPIRGNVHIPSGRAVSRAWIDRKFAKLKF